LSAEEWLSLQLSVVLPYKRDYFMDLTSTQKNEKGGFMSLQKKKTQAHHHANGKDYRL